MYYNKTISMLLLILIAFTFFNCKEIVHEGKSVENDSDAPKIGIIYPADNTVIESANHYLEGTLYDNVKVQTIFVGIERITDPITKYNPRPVKIRKSTGKQVWKYRMPNLKSGKHIITATASDPSGNYSVTKRKYTVNIDEDEYMLWRIYIPYIYQYGVGTLFFIIGIIFIVRSKSYNRKVKSDRIGFYILLFGIVYFILFHGIWSLLAIG